MRLPTAELALIAVAAVWGLTFVMVQDAVEVVPVMTFLGYRFTAAAVVVALVFRRTLADLGKEGLRAGAWMGLFLTSGYIFQTFGLQHTSASNAGFITGTFVVLTPLFGGLLFGQRTNRTAWLAAGVTAVGLALLSTGGATGVHPLGDALVFGCATSFAFHILFTDRAVKNHDTGALLAVQLGFCGLVCLTFAGAAGDLVVPRDPQVWWALAVTAFLASAVGFFIQTYAQRHASPARTALILASEPAFAGLFAYLLKDELLGFWGWLGASLILAAIVAVEAVPLLRPARPLPEG